MDGILKIKCTGKDQRVPRFYTLSVPVSVSSDDGCLETTNLSLRLDPSSIVEMAVDFKKKDTKPNHYKCIACGREWDATDAFHCRVEINGKLITSSAPVCPDCKAYYGF